MSVLGERRECLFGGAGFDALSLGAAADDQGDPELPRPMRGSAGLTALGEELPEALGSTAWPPPS